MKKVLLTMVLGILAVALVAGCGQQRAEPRGEAAGDREGASEKLQPQDEQFLQQAATSGKAELEIARMAQEKASSPAVKEFAKQLEQDHQGANDRLQQLAQDKDLDLPQMAGTEGQEMKQQMENKSGRQFDQAWLQHQVEHHQKDIAEFQKAANSSDPDVRNFAGQTLPKLQEHLKKAQQLAGGGERAGE